MAERGGRPPHAIRRFHDWVINQEELADYLAAYRQTAWELAQFYVQDLAKLAAAELRADYDLRDRVAQAVVRTAARLGRQWLPGSLG